MELKQGQDVIYCGKDCWWYIGDDPESGSPVLKDKVTKKFIVADETKITLPLDQELVMVEDLDRIMESMRSVLYTGDSCVIGIIIIIARKMYQMGYTDGSKLPIAVMIGIIAQSLHDLEACGGDGANWRDRTIWIRNALFKAGIRKNKIVVAE